MVPLGIIAGFSAPLEFKWNIKISYFPIHAIFEILQIGIGVGMDINIGHTLDIDKSPLHLDLGSGYCPICPTWSE